ncbi:hypothetical protein A3A93_01290 [Candidatus Roizmanbacteria bacterium RIFCSPLOWO2_01_FULL_38_12]|uniref:Uncharacterized protein n=1 Tax=Candidatus Roizmanbacteria bacterium RIFCSPLOWO2_01_FULL_38_12 TaxID=1802061 RepID=A0A1F7IR57_9BACT|nr:MAG: hypothetical protein A3F59_03100 [Candidatus Roizmanbacteria bacterium RIFCSPHIGHO2_12_FULL_38_13]OGK45831.1 MAG: hypothetical protein A3A93_01290 [Candidatus Roizmanbacteria bacterium RIFCSPLOWO2_01_FULL_38_12]
MKEGRRVDFDQAYSDMIDHKYAFWLIQHLLSSNQTGSNFTEMLESMRMHLNYYNKSLKELQEAIESTGGQYPLNEVWLADRDAAYYLRYSLPDDERISFWYSTKVSNLSAVAEDVPGKVLAFGLPLSPQIIVPTGQKLLINNLYFRGHNSCYRVQPEVDARLLTDLSRLVRY